MGCNFIYNNKNEIIDVREDDGSPSKLYQAALQEFGDKNKAIDLVAITKLEDFLYENPTLKTVLEFTARENETLNELTALQNQDIKNSLLSTSIASSQEFQDKIREAFYTDGILFNPTYDSLANSGIYSRFEAQNILSDISLQEKIKTSVEALNNTDLEDRVYDNFNSLERTEEVNSYGKYSILNPYIVQENIVQTLGAQKTLGDFNDAISNLEYQNINFSFSDSQQYIRAQELNRDLTARPEVDTYAQLTLAVKADADSNQIISAVNTLLNTPDSVLDNLSDAQKVLLKVVEDGGINQGIDLVGLSARTEEIKPFLRSLQAYLINPTTENTEDFTNSYNDFFEVPTANKTRVLKQTIKDRNYFYSETDQSEVELLENNLLKVDNNLYMRVIRQPLEDLYEIVRSYPEKYSGNLEQYVQERSSENSEELTLLKIYYNLPKTFPQSIDEAQETVNNEIFEGNEEYLTNDFIADFQIESLKQKQKNSPQYKNFYSNFTINSEGIALINTDPLTIDSLNSWIEKGISKRIAKNLKQYSIISKQLPILGETELDVEDSLTSRDSQRALSVNYPQTVQKIQTDNYRVDTETIIAKNATQDFIRVEGEVYEGIETKGDLTLFAKLPNNFSSYKSYNLQQPKAKTDIQNFSYLSSEQSQLKEKTVKNKNQILADNFNCL